MENCAIFIDQNYKNGLLLRLSKIFNINSLITTVFGMIGFLYRVFIFVQMCCLGYGEAIRIKKYVNFIVMNSKKIKVN
jgi:putative copper export protein